MQNFKSKLKSILTFDFFIVLLIFTFLLLISAQSVQAHVLQTDGNIGAVFHTDPDDDPIVGSVTSFFFEFKDKQNKFDPKNCDCVFTISENGKQIYTQPLFQNNQNPSLDNSSVFYTFPEKNTYQVTVTGKPNSPGAFQPFTLKYDVKVAKDATDLGSQNIQDLLSKYLPYLLGGVVGVVVLVFVLIK